MRHLLKYNHFESIRIGKTDDEKRHQKWLLSKKQDIIDCSLDLTDMPYNFKYCGNLEEHQTLSDTLVYNTIAEDEEYKRSHDKSTYYNNNFYFGDNINRSSFEIRYTGEILHNREYIPDEGFFRFGGFILSKWDGGFEFDKRSYRTNNIIEQILPNLEDVISKLKSVVFKKGEYNIYCMINMYGVQRGTCIYIRIIFKPKEAMDGKAYT